MTNMSRSACGPGARKGHVEVVASVKQLFRERLTASHANHESNIKIVETMLCFGGLPRLLKFRRDILHGTVHVATSSAADALDDAFKVCRLQNIGLRGTKGVPRKRV